MLQTGVDYLQRKTPGGIAEVSAHISPDSTRYLQRDLLVNGMYDLAPLVEAFVVAARLEHVPITRFVRQRSRESAELDIAVFHQVLLKLTCAKSMAERMAWVFNRYVSPCSAENLSVEEGHLTAKMTSLPRCMHGFYFSSTEGFVSRCMELSGARMVHFEWGELSPAGQLAGIELVNTRIDISWT